MKKILKITVMLLVVAAMVFVAGCASNGTENKTSVAGTNVTEGTANADIVADNNTSSDLSETEEDVPTENLTQDDSAPVDNLTQENLTLDNATYNNGTSVITLNDTTDNGSDYSDNDSNYSDTGNNSSS